MSTKNRILELLELQRGESVSGERLAELLGVSRNAVWKAVKELKKDGYDIAAVTNRGYCLSGGNDILSVPGISAFLSEKCLPYAGRIRIYDTLESTNKTAKQMAASGAEHGTVVIANCQTMGRGRRSHGFFSPPGCGLYLSVILRPGATGLSSPALVTELAAVSVCEAIEAVSPRTARIKWVNDVFIDGKKACGILTEAVTDLESGGVEWLVLGIGINVCTRTEDFPQELKDVAVSVFPDGKRDGVRNRLSAELINRLLGAGAVSGPGIIEKYKKRLMTLGEEVTVVKDGAESRAKAVDLDGAGRLIVRYGDGTAACLSPGEAHVHP